MNVGAASPPGGSFEPLNPPDPAALLALAEAACDAAEEVLLDGVARRAQVPMRTWSKSTATDLATEFDTAAERVIVDVLLQARPGDAVLGEEGGAQSGRAIDGTGSDSAAVRWIVDPLDGTINYVYGLPHWAVSIAAEFDGITVAAVVGVPLLGETFTALVGQGAWLDAAAGRRQLLLADAPSMDQALVATGFGYDEQRRREQAAVVADLLPAVRDIRRLGAAAVDLCHVACGRVDAYFERGCQPWDLAAGTLIAREAGARVEGFGGREPGEEMVIATGRRLFPDLHALLAQASGRPEFGGGA